MSGSDIGEEADAAASEQSGMGLEPDAGGVAESV